MSVGSGHVHLLELVAAVCALPDRHRVALARLCALALHEAPVAVVEAVGELDPGDLRVGALADNKPFVYAFAAATARPRIRLDKAMVTFFEEVLWLLLTRLLDFDR